VSGCAIGIKWARLGANARATGEVLTAEQSSNNDKGDEENTIQVLAELKKQQREPPFKAPQMDAPVQYTALAGIPAANPAGRCGCTQHKETYLAFGLHQPRPSPVSSLSLISYKLLYSSYHTASSYVPRLRRPARPRPRGRPRRLRRLKRRRQFGLPRLLPPPHTHPLREGSEALLRLLANTCGSVVGVSVGPSVVGRDWR
jgi:hypothetical protein